MASMSLQKTALMATTDSGWVSPDGKVFEVPFQNHAKWWLENNDPDYDRENEDIQGDATIRRAFSLGWGRFSKKYVNFGKQVSKQAFDTLMSLAKDSVWAGGDVAIEVSDLDENYSYVKNKMDYGKALRHFSEVLGFTTASKKMAKKNLAWISPEGEIVYVPAGIDHYEYFRDNVMDQEDVAAVYDYTTPRMDTSGAEVILGIAFNLGWIRVAPGGQEGNFQFGTDVSQAALKTMFAMIKDIVWNDGTAIIAVDETGYSETITNKMEYGDVMRHFSEVLGFTTASKKTAMPHFKTDNGHIDLYLEHYSNEDRSNLIKDLMDGGDVILPLIYKHGEILDYGVLNKSDLDEEMAYIEKQLTLYEDVPDGSGELVYDSEQRRSYEKSLEPVMASLKTASIYSAIKTVITTLADSNWGYKLAGINLDIDLGDVLYTGKWLNHPVVVKSIGTDEYGSPIINGKVKLLKVRIPKLYEKGISVH